ncbi:hypothetical protein KP509_03G027800 [Ceratopteris richardii]|nr:hypothetical protein KP509_03G027800 [Ceratopteris richardii]
MGAVGGAAFHFIKGSKNSPHGERLLGGFQAVRMNAPRVGGSFAVWGGIFSTFDCSAVYIRQKEDPWNSIFAGAATGGFLQMRHGVRSASRAALFGGVLLALIEGAGLMINRMLVNMAQPPPPPIEQPIGLPAGIPYPGMPRGQVSTHADVDQTAKPVIAEASGEKSWFGGLFSGAKDERLSTAFETSSSSGFETPSTSSFNMAEESPLSKETSGNSTGWGSWMGGFFRKKKEDKIVSTPSGSNAETLSSFESSSAPPIPSFDYKQ